MGERVTRRELRQQRRRHTNNYTYLKKGGALMGTALVTCSVAAPLIHSKTADAEEGKTQASTSQVDKTAFINQLAKKITPLADENDLYSSVLLAQAILESNWGENEFSQAPYFNLFGLEGKYLGNARTFAKENPLTGEKEQKELKKYDSEESAIKDYIAVLKDTEKNDEVYFSDTFKSNASSYQAAAEALQDTFSEAPNYGADLIKIIDENDLTRFDQKQSTTTATKEKTATAPKKYVVQSGDSVWSITQEFAIDSADFVDWNNIQNNTIYTGQTVIVGQTDNASATVSLADNTNSPATPVVENMSNQTASGTQVQEATVTENTITAENNQVTTPESTENISEVPQTSEVVVEEPTNTVESTPEVSAPVENTTEETTEVNNATENNQTSETVSNGNTETTNPTEEAVSQEPETSTENTTNENTSGTTENVTNETNNEATGNATTNSQGQAVVSEAEKYIGTEYTWGGKNPETGFDCSGLTQYVYKQATGKDIGGWTVAQESSGSKISVNDAQDGDLLFWGEAGSTSHVAISAGQNSYIHAPRAGTTVQYGSTEYYTPDFGVRVK